MKNILFVSPNASASGAPKLLLNLAKALQETSNTKTDFLFKSSGLFLEKFKELGKVIILDQLIENNIIVKAWNKFWKLEKTELEKAKVEYNNYDIIIFNTVTNGIILPIIRRDFKGKIVTYIHELKTVTNFFTTAESLNIIDKNSDLFFVPSEIVKIHLVENCGFEEKKINILPYYIPEDVSVDSNFNTTDFIVGGCGTVELRKGTDIFIQIALFFKRNFPEKKIKFVWQGANINSLDYQFLQEDIFKLGISNICTFLPSTTTIDNFYNSISIFTLTSREDPYPLVVLEAANAKIPTICFDKAGGAVDFVHGNGKIIDYLNIPAMIDAILWYYNHPQEKIEEGFKAKQKLQKLHQNKNQICETLLGVI